MRSWRKLFVFSSVYLTGSGSLRQCQVAFVFSDIDPPFFIANQQILKLTVSTGCILIFPLCRWLWRTARIRASNFSALNGFVPENARNELLRGAANNRSNFVPIDFAAAKSALSLRRKAACRSKTCKLPSKKSALYCTRDPAKIIRTIICRNNIDTYPPYWVLLVLRRVEGRFC